MLRLCADVAHAREAIDYRPRVTLAEGLAALLEWYRSQAATPEQLLTEEVVHNWALAPESR